MDYYYDEDDEIYNISTFVRNYVLAMMQHEEESELNRAINESFNESVSLQKTDNIISISSVKYSTIENKENFEKKCCICFEDFVDNCDISVLKCIHLLHMNCMVEWGKYKMTNETETFCPVCKQKI